MTSSQTQREHLLTLKVMRLTKPCLLPALPVVNEPWDMPGRTLEKGLQSDIRSPRGVERASLGEALALPQNFGTIFLGETFSSYISVHNDSEQAVGEVIFKAELQTSTQRLPVSGGHSGMVSELAAGDSMDDVIHHEVKELGTHILVCTVSYSSGGDKLHFRKFFKFQVMKPLDVKTKFYTTDEDEIFLEAQVQNIMSQPLYMESVSLEPSAQFSVSNLNTAVYSTSSAYSSGKVSYMSYNDTRQYLYRLCPKQRQTAATQRTIAPVGKLDIIWRTNFGERGRLQTSQLQHMIAHGSELRLQVLHLPDILPVEKPFTLRLQVTNTSDHSMSLRLVLNKTKVGGLLWTGISGKHHGEVAAGGFIQFALVLMPVQAGLQAIGGIRLTDISCGKTHEFENFAQVFVYTGSEQPQLEPI